MKNRRIIYSSIALAKRKSIKKVIKNQYGQLVADRHSRTISKTIAKLKSYPQMGISMKEAYDIDCEYYMIFVEHNYFVYRIFEDKILILEVFNEKEDFIYQLFGIVTTSQESLEYWGDE